MAMGTPTGVHDLSCDLSCDLPWELLHCLTGYAASVHLIMTPLSPVCSVFGIYDGSVKYYLNVGSASSPAFTLQTGASNPLNGTDVGTMSSPWSGDMNGDGLSDW